MKRKKGNKGGTKKGAKSAPSIANDPALAPVTVDIEDSSSFQNDDDQLSAEMDVDPPHVGSDKLSNTSIIDTGHPDDKSTVKGGSGRVKVKLKSARILEPHKNHSDAQTPSDAPSNNPLPPSEMNGSAMEKEDSSDGKTSGMQNALTEKTPWKAGSIKIKSSRGLGLLSEVTQDKNLNKLTNSLKLSVERNLLLSDNDRIADPSVPRNLHQRETEVVYADHEHNEKELTDALVVIKKVMKMDAAEPFNSPVDPVALGIPDYFDVIDYPMDFGTVCHELEHGSKYMNSEDVYKDVQFIWDNCYTYNNKGDYIIELMKRVKKNFMKYWVAAGLYVEMSGNGALGTTESTQVGDAVRSSQEKLYPKGKSKNKRQRHGIDRHKSDCLCAVCIVRRRRKERDESQMAVGCASLLGEVKPEEYSPLDNQYSKHASSSLDPSQETDANVDMEEFETEEKLEITDSARSRKLATVYNEIEPNQNTRTPSQKLLLGNATRDDSRQQSQEEENDMDFASQPGDENDDLAVQEQALAYDLQQMDNKQRESAEGRLLKMQGSQQLEENHSIFPICRSIFSSDKKSLWNGPHSLIRRHVPVRQGLIHAAVASFMKP